MKQWVRHTVQVCFWSHCNCKIISDQTVLIKLSWLLLEKKIQEQHRLHRANQRDSTQSAATHGATHPASSALLSLLPFHSSTVCSLSSSCLSVIAGGGWKHTHTQSWVWTCRNTLRLWDWRPQTEGSVQSNQHIHTTGFHMQRHKAASRLHQHVENMMIVSLSRVCTRSRLAASYPTVT